MEKRQKELIVFGVAIFVLGLLAVMTLGKGKRPQSSPTANKPGVQVATRTDAPDGQATSGQKTEPVEDKGPILPYQGSIVGHARERDPFVPTVTVGFAARAAQVASATPTGSIPPVPTGPPPMLTWPGGSGIIGAIRPADPNVGSAVSIPSPPADPIVLTGIIQGDPPVAVLRRAEKRFIVKPGDEFAGYRVIEIAAQRVALARGNKHHSLFLGGKL